MGAVKLSDRRQPRMSKKQTEDRYGVRIADDVWPILKSLTKDSRHRAIMEFKAQEAAKKRRKNGGKPIAPSDDLSASQSVPVRLSDSRE